MSAKVVKPKDQDTLIRRSESNPEFGSVMVIETRTNFQNGFVDVRNRVGFINGKYELLQKLNWQEGQILPVKVVYKRSFDASYEGQEPQKYPAGHKLAGEIITSGGAPIYLNKIVVDENSPEQDVIFEIDHEDVVAEVTTPAEAFANRK